MSQTTELANRMPTVQSFLQSPAYKKRIEDALTEDGARTFVSDCITLSQNNKLLATADPKTVIAAAFKGALLKLPLEQSLGYAWVVPYAGKAQFQLGYKGMIQLAQRSRQLAKLNPVVVYPRMLKYYNPLTGDIELDFENADYDAEPIGYAIYMKLSSGFEKTEYWTRNRVERHAKRFSQAFSKGYDSPWKTDFDAMAIKTVMKHVLGHYAPMSVDLQQGITSDQAVLNMDGEATDYPDALDVQFTRDEDAAEEEAEQPAAQKAAAAAKKKHAAKKTAKKQTAQPSNPPANETPSDDGAKDEEASTETPDVKEKAEGSEPEKPEPSNAESLPPTLADICRDAYKSIEESGLSRDEFHVYLMGEDIFKPEMKSMMELPPETLKAIAGRIDDHIAAAKETTQTDDAQQSN